MSAHELVEEELERRATEVDEMMFGELVEQFFSDRLFASRKRAEEMAERLEAFAVDANLEEGVRTQERLQPVWCNGRADFGWSKSTICALPTASGSLYRFLRTTTTKARSGKTSGFLTKMEH